MPEVTALPGSTTSGRRHDIDRCFENGLPDTTLEGMGAMSPGPRFRRALEEIDRLDPSRGSGGTPLHLDAASAASGEVGNAPSARTREDDERAI